MTTFRHRSRKARVVHNCADCHRVIEVGETYIEGGAFGGGTAWTWRECAHCRAVLVMYDIPGLECEYNDETFAEWARGDTDDSRIPVSVAELRHRAGYRRGWRVKYGPRAGDLMPVPA